MKFDTVQAHTHIHVYKHTVGVTSNRDMIEKQDEANERTRTK
jgi:hypothetical protein